MTLPLLFMKCSRRLLWFCLLLYIGACANVNTSTSTRREAVLTITNDEGDHRYFLFERRMTGVEVQNALKEQLKSGFLSKIIVVDENKRVNEEDDTLVRELRKAAETRGVVFEHRVLKGDLSE